jgi:hypothetical protein
MSNLLASVKVLSAAANKNKNPNTTVAIFCIFMGTVIRTYTGVRRRMVEMKTVIVLMNVPKRLREK